MRWTEADLKRLQTNTRQIKSGAAKYNNRRTQVDGWWFDSQLEADRYRELKLLKASGYVLWFICQAPFRLPGGITYKADFVVVWWDLDKGTTVEDCKGMMTRVSQNKIKQVEELYGIKVEIITRDGVARSR
jgi:hypothetical protein